MNSYKKFIHFWYVQVHIKPLVFILKDDFFPHFNSFSESPMSSFCIIYMIVLHSIVCCHGCILQAMKNAADHNFSDLPSSEDDSGDMELTSVGIDNHHGNNQEHPVPTVHLEKEEEKENKSTFATAHPKNEHKLEEEEEEEKEEEGFGSSEIKLSSEDTERLLCKENSDNGGGGEEVWRTRVLYKSSSKLCQSKISILVCRGLTFVVSVALLLAGLVVALSLRHHPLDCDQEGLTSASLDCSLLCSQFMSNTVEALDTPTEILATPTCSIMPTPTKALGTPTCNSLLPMPTNTEVFSSRTIQFQGGGGVMESVCLCDIVPTPYLFNN